MRGKTTRGGEKKTGNKDHGEKQVMKRDVRDFCGNIYFFEILNVYLFY